MCPVWWLRADGDRITRNCTGCCPEADGSHEIWYNEQTDLYTTIPNHAGDIPEGTVRAILKEAGIDLNDFLKKK
ncbi:MAG: type II toxin-antitoxin system HicA family toxin [Deltaproteobacteria bacterium]|nr:type II toxin-antitoxin system HicA family toxin [Deltaproteobacteria bacterium]MBW2078697.1 type II toxin-antitoxin system HicA family toxin [Deltaproteobacteria bacterium]MBW2312454.1 type II toxin-antitoxin system HicA family toxin [Deltaproteobacteria bacterium]